MYAQHIADQFEPELPPDTHTRDEIEDLLEELDPVGKSYSQRKRGDHRNWLPRSRFYS